MFKKKPAKEKTISTKNPMEDSDYCYYQTLGKALVGFAKALELRERKLSAVTAKDILDFTDIDKQEFDFLFTDPHGLLEAVQKEVEKIFSEAEAMLDGMDNTMKLNSLFGRLRKNSPMLEVLRLTADYNIWRNSMKGFVAELAVEWPPADSEGWMYLYGNFCLQFALILEKWADNEYSEENIADCVRLAEVWLEADGMLGDTAEDVIGSWDV